MGITLLVALHRGGVKRLEVSEVSALLKVLYFRLQMKR